MAWLRLTLQDESMVLVNSTQITDMTALSNNRGTEMQMTSWAKRVRESVDEIAAMIADAERRDRVDGIFRAIVCNFPHGYDPGEIWKTAETMLAKWNEKQEI